MSQPLVSVVIPTYNRAGLVARAIRSVLAQTVQDFEIIVVDDASRDDTEAAVKAVGDSRISFYRHDSNRGPGAGRNTGIEHARGEYLAFLDSDDEWLPAKLERQLEAFRTTRYPDLGAVQCAVVVVAGDDSATGDAEGRAHGGLVVRPPRFSGDCFDSVLATLGMPSTGSVVMVTRRVIESGVRFDETLPAYEDYEFFLHASRGFQVETILTPLSIKHEEFAGPHVWSRPNIIAGARGVIDMYEAELDARPKAMARRRHALAMTLFRAGDVRGAREQLRAVTARRPLAPASWLWLGVAALGPRAYLFAYPKVSADRKLRRLGNRVGFSRRTSQATR